MAQSVPKEKIRGYHLSTSLSREGDNEMYTTKKLLSVSTLGFALLALSGCGESEVEASSMGAEDPLQLAQIHLEAINDEDMSTVCAYAVAEETQEVASWTGAEATCADNATAVVNSRQATNAFVLQGTDIDWDMVTVEYEDEEEQWAWVEIGGADPDAENTVTIYADYVEGIGWQTHYTFE